MNADRNKKVETAEATSVRVDVVEAGKRPRRGHIACEIGSDIKFSTSHLESYCLAQWEPVVFDALVVAAAIEFCDRIEHRPAQHWGRNFNLRIPVHDPARWSAKPVSDALHSAISFLTGDRWEISFVPRACSAAVPQQINFDISTDASAVIPFSEGLDSRAVAGLMHRKYGDSLIRVRLGSKPFDPVSGGSGEKQPFTSVPYRVKPKKLEFRESSARSRGFKFGTVSGIAAYLVKASQVIVPESGQGSLGTALVTVGQGYEDYRNHPLFTDKMEKYLEALFNYRVRFEFPRMWFTKGETLATFVNECADGTSWQSTWSCWQQNRQASVGGHKRQCGICAACMLRRLSVHAASLSEPAETYVWENLSAVSFESGAAIDFKHVSEAQREYGIAGALHLDHLASLRSMPSSSGTLNLTASQLARSRKLPEQEVKTAIARLLDQHKTEWKSFLDALGPESFVARWAAKS